MNSSDVLKHASSSGLGIDIILFIILNDEKNATAE